MEHAIVTTDKGREDTMAPQYKIQKIEKPLDDGTGRTVKVWRVIDEAEGGSVTNFARKSEASDFADDMNEREGRKPRHPARHK